MVVARCLIIPDVPSCPFRDAFFFFAAAVAALQMLIELYNLVLTFSFLFVAFLNLFFIFLLGE